MTSVLIGALAAFVAFQEPTGIIEAVVRDPSGALLENALVQATHLATQNVWTAIPSDTGRYAIPRLPAGRYTLTARVAGFPTSISESVVVEIGTTTPVVFQLEIGGIANAVTISGASPLLPDDSSSVGGAITPEFIENIPLNGRNVLELGKTNAGVREATRSLNRFFLDVLGAPQGTPGRGTRYTTDGASNMAIGNGGSVMNFSTDAIREVRVLTVDWDLSVGATVSGVFSAVTRQGGSYFHGSAFYYFRDHNLAAYPGLSRDPANPDPFFQRRQFGFTASGPVLKNVYFFSGWERTDQRGVNTSTFTTPEFSHFSGITSSPFFEDLVTVRLDSHLPNEHRAFFRYSRAAGWSFEPPTMGQQNTYPSRWFHNSAAADQFVFGLTSPIGRTAVNSAHVSFFSPGSRRNGARETDCMGCVGVGHPAINIPQAAFSLGSSDRNVTEGDRFQLNDSLMWQRGNRRTVVGVDWEHNRGGPLDWRHEPATLTLFSPSQARQARISVPAEYRTLEDILSLPLRTVSVAVGDARLPQANGDFTRLWNTFRLYFQETWRVEPRLVMNYGLAWNLDRNLNYDLTLPQLLAPVVGEDNLGRRHKQWTNFSPLFGLSWRLPPGEKTVVRLGAARFFDFLFPFNLDAERVALGPPGLGRQSFPGSFIPNLLPGIPNVPVATPLDFTSPTQFTGANFMSILPEIRDYLLETMNSGDQFVQQIQILKTGNLVAPDFPTASAFHANVGISQQVTDVFVVSADFAYKQFSHVGIGPVDVNLYDRPEDRGGPVIPKCVDDEQRTDPHAHCSTGPINIVQPVGRASYRGLLIKAEKRLSHGFSFVGSWAFSKNTGTSDAVANGFNLEDWHENHGPLPTDFTHIFNFAGMARLPLRLELGFNFSCLSAPPFSAYLTGIDFNGDGFNGDLTINPNLGDLLPGSTVNTFNRGMNREDLTRLVNQFNQTYAGTEDARGASIPWVTLPADYALADNFHSLDLRLSRTWSFERRVQFTVIGEVFNAYNASNLYGHSGNLTNAATFGQPTARSSQVFGSGGPRAFQFGLKVGF